MKKKSGIYLGGEKIDENKMMPQDFSDFLRSFVKDIFRRGK